MEDIWLIKVHFCLEKIEFYLTLKTEITFLPTQYIHFTTGLSFHTIFVLYWNDATLDFFLIFIIIYIVYDQTIQLVYILKL